MTKEELKKLEGERELTNYQIHLLGAFDRHFEECVEAAQLTFGEEQFEYFENYYETDYIFCNVGRSHLIKTDKITKEKYEEEVMKIEEENKKGMYVGRRRAKFYTYEKKLIKTGWKEELIKMIKEYKD